MLLHAKECCPLALFSLAFCEPHSEGLVISHLVFDLVLRQQYFIRKKREGTPQCQTAIFPDKASENTAFPDLWLSRRQKRQENYNQSMLDRLAVPWGSASGCPGLVTSQVTTCILSVMAAAGQMSPNNSSAPGWGLFCSSP
ncbi:hypothetical protein HJG60_011154 [Phyllostomus discolor]|uniref:Uncharacterized protein n=1 Tax=Phyllostomus discolor TaxID=89673 RepID=A0A834E7H5_9CHIR|nr:hypothetical protein HJG60_011154 [Phyllostomus discolor]